MLELFILMMERVGLIILLAFLLVNVPYFKKILLSRNQLSSKLQLILVFGIFTLISNLTGIEITSNEVIPSNILTNISLDTSIANTRTLAVEEQLAEGLASIFSSQIELDETEVQSKLLKEAEIKSLQAQVNPHFFFNAPRQ